MNKPNELTCQELVDRLPDWVAGRIDVSEAALVAAHLAGCVDCTAEARVLAGLYAARPEAPAGLAARITEELRSGSARPPVRVRCWSRPAWTISAAAAVVLAAGTVVLNRTSAPEPRESVGETASVLGDVVDDSSEAWLTDDGVVAGAPVLDDLSDDDLATLAQELGA